MRCCWTTRTDFDRVTTTSRTTPTARMIRKISSPDNSLSPDERRCALHLDDPDHLARVDDLCGVVGPSLPQLATDFDHPLPVADLLDHGRLGPLDRLVPERRRFAAAMQPTLDGGPDVEHTERRDSAEDHQLERQRKHQRGYRGGQGPRAKHDQNE